MLFSNENNHTNIILSKNSIHKKEHNIEFHLCHWEEKNFSTLLNSGPKGLGIKLTKDRSAEGRIIHMRIGPSKRNS